MRTLWFRGEFVHPILAGAKTDTWRRRSNRLPKVGEIVAFSVGPRPPFATVKVLSIEIVEPDDDPQRWQLASSLTGNDATDMVRITFRLLSSTPAPAPHPPAKREARRTRKSRSA